MRCAEMVCTLISMVKKISYKNNAHMNDLRKKIFITVACGKNIFLTLELLVFGCYSN